MIAMKKNDSSEKNDSNEKNDILVSPPRPMSGQAPPHKNL